MTDQGSPVPGSGGQRSGSKGIAVSNWLVAKASGLLEKKSSRRGFLVGSAMVGSAVAVAGCNVATTPGSAYNHITDCAGGLCTDGYTDFCCTINSGVNACPPNSFWGGWWRADYSSFCSGTRYYIDCMEYCSGPRTGYQNFCAGSTECRCAGDCNTRRVYCNYFRYGQCHQEVVASGPIACRVVTCTPPYAIDPSCSTATAVDNSTAEHTSPCITNPPAAAALPPVGTAIASSGGVSVFVRSSDLFIGTRSLTGGSWSQWAEIAPPVVSCLTSAADSTGLYVIGKGVDNQIRFNRQLNGTWTGEGILPGLAPTSDPTAVADPTGLYVFCRGVNRSVSYGRFVGGTWSGWNDIGGTLTSNLAAVATAWGIHVFARGTDKALWYNKFSGGAWSGWASLGGTITSDPSAVTFFDGALWVFARQVGNSIWSRRFDGSSWSGWASLTGNAESDPSAVVSPQGLHVFVRGTDRAAWCNRNFGGGWTGFQPLGGIIDTDISVAADVSGTIYAFARGTDRGLWVGTYANYAWSGWQPLGGNVAPVTALT